MDVKKSLRNEENAKGITEKSKEKKQEKHNNRENEKIQK